MFHLSEKYLTPVEIRDIEKRLSFLPTPNMINEADPGEDFEECSRKIKRKWYLKNDVTDNLSEMPAFKPPLGHPGVELLLSRLEEDLFFCLANIKVTK